MQLYVGQSGLQGNVQRYASRFDMVELPARPDRLPRMNKLKEWRAAVPAEFVFCIDLPPIVASLDEGPVSQAALEYAQKAFRALDAGWWVLRTPAGTTPSPGNQRRLGGLVERLFSTGKRIAWEPRGVWQGPQAVAAAQSHGIYLVRDLSRDEPIGSEVVYTRLRALGSAARVGAGAAERVAERVADCREAYVVVEGSGAARVRQVLREELQLTNSQDNVTGGG